MKGGEGRSFLARLGLRAPDPAARAWREIDLEALAHNAAALQGALSPGCRLMAVVKADAYGHGAVQAARCLEAEGVRAFAVACLSEGIALRRAGIREMILILGWTDPAQAEQLRRWRLTQTVADEAHGEALAARGVPVSVHLALDTGMHRLGIPAEDRAAIARLYRLPSLRITGVYSHLCVCDSRNPRDRDYTAGQLKAFYHTVEWMRENRYDPGAVHIQASHGIWNLPPQPCTYARAGIALYGVGGGPEEVRHPLALRPVLSLRARVGAVRPVAAGAGVGYDLAFQPRRDTRLAVVTVGYGDGLPRSLSQQGGVVLLRGRRCPMVGRMCMDQLLVDVTDVGAAAGDVVTLIGRDGEETLTAEEVARQCATIPNELLSRLGERLPVIC